MIPRWRSLLFVAADDHARVAKIASRGADAVIFDLEDAVPIERKAAAREALVALSAMLGDAAGVVRINAAWRDVLADLAVAVRPGVAAIMVPKVEDPGRLTVVAEMVGEYAVAAGLAAPPGLIALVESPAGVAALDALAAVPGVVALALGSEDFSLALGVPPTPEALDLPCKLLALAAARHGRMALGLPVSIATIDDDAAWDAAIERARAIGITGALCVHPRQVLAANRGFAPTPAQRAAAERIVAAWQAAGSSGVIRVEGMMVDRPVALAAERILAAQR